MNLADDVDRRLGDQQARRAHERPRADEHHGRRHEPSGQRRGGQREDPTDGERARGLLSSVRGRRYASGVIEYFFVQFAVHTPTFFDRAVRPILRSANRKQRSKHDSPRADGRARDQRRRAERRSRADGGGECRIAVVVVIDHIARVADLRGPVDEQPAARRRRRRRVGRARAQRRAPRSR